MPRYDLMGAEDILGASHYDNDLAILAGGQSLLGYNFGADDAAAAVQDAHRNQMARALAIQSGGASALVTRQPSKSRRYTQGFGPVSIPGGQTVLVTVQPQTIFKGKRLVIPSDFAGVILINDLKIGNVSQFTSSNPVPGRGFTEFAVGTEQDFDTAQISQQISLNVTNTSNTAVTFTAMIVGLSVS